MCNDDEKYSSWIQIHRNLPLNRDAIVPLRKDATSTLAQCTGLKFILPYSPARRYKSPITQEAVFTEEEESRFQKRSKKVMILLLMIVITNGKKSINQLMMVVDSLIKSLI